MASKRLLVASSAQLPLLDPDDRSLSTELERLGFAVQPAVWTDRRISWAAADACIIRSTWDYHADPEAFLRWAEAVSNRTLMINPFHIIRWNAHKFYLRDLQSAGVPIVPTLWLERGRPIDLDRALSDRAWPEAVIKPAYGASADGVLHVKSDSRARAEGQLHIEHLLQSQDALLQPYLSTITTHHERALVFIDGVYSHAVTKTPFMHANVDLTRRALLPPETSGEIPVSATADELAVATMAIDASPPGHVFVRVDLVQHDGSPHVLEVEMIEPALYLFAKPSAAKDLATSIASRV